MEDNDSIFVCFVCELEFREVSKLNNHMATHNISTNSFTDPDEDLEEEVLLGDNDNSEPDSPTVLDISNQYAAMTPDADQNLEQPSAASIGLNDEIHEKFFTAQTVKSSDIKNKVLESNDIGKAFSTNKEIEKLVIKSEPNDESEVLEDSKVPLLTMRRAMNLKRFIEKQIEAAKLKQLEENKSLADDDEEMMDESMQPEGVVMVNTSFFDSSEVNGSYIGATVMNSADPEGFVIPPKHSSIDDNLSDEEDATSSGFSYEDSFSAGSVNGVRSGMKQGAHVFGSSKQLLSFSSRGRGRTPRKRGRKKSVEERLEYMDSLKIYYEEGRQVKHSINMENQRGSIFKCIECHKKFRSYSAMKIHSKSHMEDKEIPCPYCSKVFPQRYVLYEHLVADHGEESMNLVCPVCKKVFTRPDSLKSHMVRMHEEDGGLNCFVCGKNFPSQGQLEMHVRVHTGERPFKCEICSKRFVQKVHLNTHLRSMHQVSNGNLTPCRLCDKMFSGRITLRDHYTRFHKMNTCQYKTEVARLRREGKIPEVVPPKVSIVDPSFRYTKVDASELDDDDDYIPMVDPDFTPPKKFRNSRHRGKTESKGVGTRSSGMGSRRPGMGTILCGDDSDNVMFAPGNFEPKARDQEELNIVESAFKVAEEMDQMRDGTSAILMTDPGSDSTIYYSIPIEMADGVGDDDEYAQFAAEHAHMDDVGTFEVIDSISSSQETIGHSDSLASTSEPKEILVSSSTSPSKITINTVKVKAIKSEQTSVASNT